uniref:Uncharacterized protein n=1 Tax=Arcella intermedia TaxID=1963864 RepID=A0A6B2LH34_9EUKA
MVVTQACPSFHNTSLSLHYQGIDNVPILKYPNCPSPPNSLFSSINLENTLPPCKVPQQSIQKNNMAVLFTNNKADCQNNTGLIVGIVVGVIVFLVLLFLVLAYRNRKLRRLFLPFRDRIAHRQDDTEIGDYAEN